MSHLLYLLAAEDKTKILCQGKSQNGFEYFEKMKEQSCCYKLEIIASHRRAKSYRKIMRIISRIKLLPK